MKVSIVCPVFNTASTLLRESISSVLAQDEEGNCKIILVDDASECPKTLRTLDDLAKSDRRVSLLRLTSNKGPSSARAAGVRAASGEWIGFLDSDDQWMANALERFRSAVATVPEARWIAGHYRSLHLDGRIEENPRPSAAISGTVIRPGLTRLNGPVLTRYLLSSFRIHIGSMLVHSSVFRLLTNSGFTEGLFYGDDWLLSLRLSVITALFFLDNETYTLRRDHESIVMDSNRRLTSDLLTPLFVAAKDPSLRAFRRELTWAIYGMRKGLALNNMLSGRHWASVEFALRAYFMDPRQLGDLGRFIRLLLMSKNERAVVGTQYSTLEQFVAR